MIRTRAHVQELQAYVAPLEGRRKKLRLDFNENTQGPSPAVVEAIRKLPETAYATYPEYADLDDAFAAAYGVEAAQVGLFNGVDAAIRAVFDAFGEEGATFLTTAPTFGYYGPCAAQHGMVLEAIAYGDDLSFPIEQMRGALRKAPRICFICNPNNPTGTLVQADTVLDLVESAPNTLFVLDELYADFTGETLLPAGAKLPNLLVLRSLSKAAGLAALRIGVAIGNRDLQAGLEKVTGPYDVNMFAVVAARAALADPGYVQDYVAEVEAAKAWTVSELSRRNVRVHSGGGNFVLVFPDGDNAAVVEGLAMQGILVRNMDGKPLLNGSFRLSIGTRDQMARFMRAFSAVTESA